MQPLNPATWPADTPVVRVGDLCVDLRYRRLCTAEGEVELSSRVFDVLLLFLAEPNRLHTRESLLQRIWAGVVVEDGNLTQTVSVLRRLLGDERKLWIRTVAKRGYVFEPPGPVLPLELDDEGLRLAGGDVVSARAAGVASAQPIAASATPRRPRRALPWLAAAAVVFGLAISWLGGAGCSRSRDESGRWRGGAPRLRHPRRRDHDHRAVRGVERLRLLDIARVADVSGLVLEKTEGERLNLRIMKGQCRKPDDATVGLGFSTSDFHRYIDSPTNRSRDDRQCTLNGALLTCPHRGIPGADGTGIRRRCSTHGVS